MYENTLNPLPVATIVHKRYQVETIVGRGGLGTVYSVRDILFGKQNIYALKEMADQSRSARRQFEHEAQWLQALDHNHIPKVREYFEWQSRLYLVMDFVDGENLEQKLYHQHGRPLSEEQAIAWILPICDALEYLHSHQPPILHRDVKPANIIVTPAGHPVLVDLGIAKEHLPGANRTATFVRKAGTEGYAPPEQYTLAGKSGPWSDVYALGATLYHLLTTQVPISAIDRVTQDPDLIRPHYYNSAISEQSDAAICRAMAMRPSVRFQSVAAFAAALSGSSETFNSRISGTLRGPMPSAPSFAPGWDPQRAPRSMPPGGSPYPGSSSPSQPFSRTTSPGGAASPRSPSPPSRYPSFTGSRPQPSQPTTYDMGNIGGMNNLGQIDVPLPPLPPTPPSIVETLGRPSQPVLQNSPEAKAAQFERIRASIADTRKRVTSVHREGGNRGLLLTAISLALILFVVGIATVMIVPRLAPPDRSSPQAAITGYFNALEQGDSSRAWQFVSASRNDTGSQSTFAQNLHADDARLGKVVSIRITSVENDNTDHITATVQVTRANDVRTPIVYSIALSQYDGTTWLIDSISNQ
ncbi:MAG TPA: serine/threonine-protein kinase [Ktedonobacterales bacterium]|nr:serine/threonine-protein kinase [Ktedonobacterales bacterium]